MKSKNFSPREEATSSLPVPAGVLGNLSNTLVLSSSEVLKALGSVTPKFAASSPWTQGTDLLDFVNDQHRSSLFLFSLCPICPRSPDPSQPAYLGLPIEILIFIFIHKGKGLG